MKKNPLITAQRYILTGFFTLVPVLVTLFLVKFISELLAKGGKPVIAWLTASSTLFSKYLSDPLVQSVLSIIFVLVALYVLGWVTTRIVGRKLIKMVDSFMERIPIAKTIYGSVKKFVSVMEKKPDGVQRVVLIDFPSPEMKTVGFVTRILKDQDTGRELAAVYVPTTPNPTSGYLEIVPLERVTPTTWSVDEAMTFIVTAGAVAPDTMHYEKGAVKKRRKKKKSPN